MCDLRFITIAEAAARLGIHPNTLRAYADMGEIAYVRLPGGHRRFTGAEIEDFKMRHRGAPKDVPPQDVEIEP